MIQGQEQPTRPFLSVTSVSSMYSYFGRHLEHRRVGLYSTVILGSHHPEVLSVLFSHFELACSFFVEAALCIVGLLASTD